MEPEPLLQLYSLDMAENLLVSAAGRRQIGQFLAAAAFFHGSEYVLAVLIHGRANVDLGSLLISKKYVLAMACALLEYVIEILLFPELKELWWISNIGLAMVLIGEIIRKSGILTAARAFTHIIRSFHEDHHELVTHGIYRLLWLLHMDNRNPSYALQSNLLCCFHGGHLAILFY